MTAMPRLSAGLLMYRIKDGVLQVLLAHPGGPFFVKKDDGAWSIPKGEPDADEDLLVTAQREFEEETGVKPTGPFIPLKPIQQKGGKIVHAWAFEGDCDPELPSRATRSRWSGRRSREGSRSSPRSTGPSASIWQRPGRRSRRGRRR